MSSERLLWRVRRSQRRPAAMGGYLPLAPGVSTVRYPIPERIFDYVSTVRSATAGTCQKRSFAAREDIGARDPEPTAELWVRSSAYRPQLCAESRTTPPPCENATLRVLP
jgi:hypothetical protein